MTPKTTTLPPRLLRALDRFHAARPWDHNAHYHRWILRQLPERFDRALDVGSGSGDLARRLAARATGAGGAGGGGAGGSGGSVVGVDADPAMVARARGLTRAGAPLTFTTGDAMGDGMPPGPYDVITCVAVLHHLPFAEALARFRQQLAPGGTLIVVGVARTESRVDRLIGTAAVPANVAMAVLKNKGRKVGRPAAMTAPVRPAGMSFAEISRGARRVLPGARLRRRLFWRYTLVWHAPAMAPVSQ
ncbi:class I SAM-dependent methyltransferase [Streptomyces sp. NPDC021093]|uniref:class I SAM-dependent methyltransferase n=1 Tax=Streptomyces sp. NPDC021093 TaxID=3365112 RepID=UPI003794545F